MPEQPEKAFARWLVSIGYPWDVSYGTNPPPVSLDALALAWQERDGDSDMTLQNYRDSIEWEITDA